MVETCYTNWIWKVRIRRSTYMYLIFMYILLHFPGHCGACIDLRHVHVRCSLNNSIFDENYTSIQTWQLMSDGFLCHERQNCMVLMLQVLLQVDCPNSWHHMLSSALLDLENTMHRHIMFSSSHLKWLNTLKIKSVVCLSIWHLGTRSSTLGNMVKHYSNETTTWSTLLWKAWEKNW